MKKLLFLFLICLTAAARSQAQQGQGWQFIQDNALFFCQGSGITGCSGGQFVGNMTATVAGSIWLLSVQGPNNFTITSVTGGGGTWVHCPNCHVKNPSGLNVDAWYNLCISGGTACNTGETGSHLAFTLSGSAGTSISVTFIEILPPAGTTVSLDTSSNAAPTGCSGPSHILCNAATVTTTATDVIIQNAGGIQQGAWNAWSSPYTTTANGSGIALNVAPGTISATQNVTPCGAGTPTTCNPEFFAIAFKSSAGTFTAPTSQYSIVQTALAMGPAQQSGGGINCGGSGCSIALPQATAAGNLLFVDGNSSNGGVINSISCAPVGCTTGASAPVIPTGNSSSVCQRSDNNIPGETNATFSCGWILSVPAGVTSITVVASSTLAFTVTIVEVKANAGGNWRLDAQGSTQLPATTPGGPGNQPVQALTLDNPNDVIFSMFWANGGSNAPNYYPYLNLNWYCTGGGGTFPCNPLNYTTFNEASIGILVDSGPTAPSALWVNPQNTASMVTGVAFTVNPPTINAADCNSSSVQTALNSVTVDGTTVAIPAGTCTWSTGVTYTANSSTIIQGQTTVTGTCGPSDTGGTCTATDNTNIQVATSTGSGGPAALTVHAVSGKTIRVTGISFMWSSGTQQFVGMLHIDGATNAMRVDHNHFFRGNIYDLQIVGTTGPLTGVVDHNFYDTFVGNEFANSMLELNWSGTEPSTTPTYPNGNGNSSWSMPLTPGGSQNIFYENNWLVWDGGSGSTGHGFAYDCAAGGGRVVFRFNQVGPHMLLQTHGTGSGDQNFRSCRAQDIYGNNFFYDSAPNGSNTNTFASQLNQEEGGFYYIWNNRITGFQTNVDLDYVRSNNNTYGQSSTPGGWGYCATSPIGGVAGPSVWDVSGSGPCVDQTGRGQSDPITGIFPTKVDSISNTQSWPNQAKEPAYAWGNTFNTFPNITQFYWRNFASSNVVTDSDYFLEIPRLGTGGSFNGTSGVGCGPAAGTACTNPVAQPTTCTQGTGYWNPATSTLYQCGSSNNFVAFYTPYTYPHPLDTSATNNPAVILNPTSLAFGNQPITTKSNAQTVTLNNVGTASLSITSISISGTNPGDFLIVANTCGATLTQGTNCTVNVAFQPTALGSRTANLTFVTNAPTSPDNVSLSGTGTPVAPVTTIFALGSSAILQGSVYTKLLN